MIRTQIQLTEEQAAALKAQSAKTGQSVAEIIRRSLDQTLRTVGPSDEERRRRAIAVLGRFHDGANLAEEHDRYFVEAILAKDDEPT